MTILAASAAGQQITREELQAALAAERAARLALEQALAAERAARQALEGRVASIEDAARQARLDQGVEAQLRALLPPEDFLGAPPRSTFPSMTNPSIGVFMDALLDAGNTDGRLGDDSGDRFSLRETEVDMQLPFAPFGTGVLVTAFEDLGNGEFETKVEEGYANLQPAAMFGAAGSGPLRDATVKVGRFRVPFGHDNQIHLHDLMQADRSMAVQELLGEEGLIGDGLGATIPVWHRENAAGLGRTSTAQVAVVNGEMLAGEETALGGGILDLADAELTSDAPMVVGRWTEFWELSPTSDIEVGASVLHDLGEQAVVGEGGARVATDFYGLDATWRHVPDETRVGSWLVQGETIHADLDVWGFSRDVPDGRRDADGWWVTVQRQMSPNTYLGARVGESDMLLTDGRVQEVNPYFSWYPDEFFRVRVQGQHLDVEREGDDDTDASRLMVQFTWNFGAHRPHPYWVNR